MTKYIDASKIKTFKLSDLVGRSINVECFRDSKGGTQIIMGIDLDSHETFVLSWENLPVGVSND